MPLIAPRLYFIDGADVNDGQPFLVALRVSFVIAKRGGARKTQHFHCSAMFGENTSR
jgi:hypothetical protein